MLTLQFVPYAEIANLGPARRVNKIIDLVQDNKIVLLEGRLKKEEEADLIAITMEKIDDTFKGIEIAVINPEQKNSNIMANVRKKMIDMLLGDRQGLTIVGPATVVKEIKKDPDKIQLFTVDSSNGVNGRKNGKKPKKKR